MLEDDYRDVLGKALRGQGVDPATMPQRLQVAGGAWRAFFEGEFDADMARACARVLGLGPDALAGHPGYHPRPLRLEGLQQLELPFGAFTVNAWWISAGGVSLLFDSGCRAGELAAVLPAMPTAAFITHGHHDHTGGVGLLQRAGVPVLAAAGGGVEAQPMAPGEVLHFGPMAVEAVEMSGHYTPALGYRVTGLARPLLVIGDALFAGSMGKTSSPHDYQRALANLRRALDGLSDEWLILPGHGPATSVGEERLGNPFLAGSAVEEGA